MTDEIKRLGEEMKEMSIDDVEAKYRASESGKTPPFYNPPYGSPLEDKFAWQILKYLKSDIEFISQDKVNTICGTYYIDFVGQLSCGKKIGFECDGKEFHDVFRDEWRDAMILGAAEADCIYRLRGCDLTYRMEDILFVISKWNPELFSERGLVNIERLASEIIQSSEYDPTETMKFVTYPTSDKESGINWMFIERRFLDIPPGTRQFWQIEFKYASDLGGGQLDDIISKYKTERLGIKTKLP